ncbi:ankyrin repeat-containing domain protein [Xylariaceae sp. FL0662B]|nr:ankyrin repeat-containing domain protein [Xylariaceae sp. FL0662B]
MADFYPEAHLCGLPTELIQMVSSHLSERQMWNSLQTCRHVYRVVRPRLLLCNAGRSASALRWACVYGDLSLVKEVLGLSVSPNITFSPSTCQHISSRPCLQRGLDLARTPLITAICYRQVDVVRHLVENGAEVDFLPQYNTSDPSMTYAGMTGRNNEYYRPLHWAVNPADVPISEACQANIHEIVEILLDFGADVRAYTGEGVLSCPPLTVAMMNRRVPASVVRMLLERGADPLKGPIGSTSLLKFFLNYRRKSYGSIEQYDVTTADKEKLHWLVQHGALENSSDHSLHHVICPHTRSTGRIARAVPPWPTQPLDAPRKIFEMLLDAGEDPNGAGDCCPIQLFCSMYGTVTPHAEFVDLLLRCGASPVGVNDGYGGPLLLAAESLMVDIAVKLLEADANAADRVNERMSASGETPVMIAAGDHYSPLRSTAESHRVHRSAARLRREISVV